ncbi:unnamed protein product [Anisakis simplex]|uniref:mRNA (guanine-N(7))-methyltransferase n=1 Tax=Anisakis simplex TaxID=6269 RepID=A0A3P6TIT9_ANISI|nr:unnamed protein product [Anisakis simplex]
MNDPNGKPPIFGAKFHFSLDTQVNCPEYLVHFPVLERLVNFGTLSKSEWEVTAMYLVFAFRKKNNAKL